MTILMGSSLTSASEPVKSVFGALRPQPADGLLALIGAFRRDPRPDKIDIGVGVYRDEAGETPVMRAVKRAEQRLVDAQPTKSYLGPEGDVGFFKALTPMLFGDRDIAGRVDGLQTPGGTGALRLACELIAQARPGARIWVGVPTWPNHAPIIKATGLELVPFDHFDVASQQLTFDRMIEALRGARAGDVVLLHGCCHNPTGADLDSAQWKVLAQLLAERGVLPLIDIAYQGLGRGLDEDAAGVRIVADIVGEALIAYSCDKNFGLYRERTGAIFALTRTADALQVVRSNLMSLARVNWSMPPDHGGAVVRIILSDADLRADWDAELTSVRDRIAAIRRLLADADPALAPLAAQNGMFSMLPLSPEDVGVLRERYGIYMPASGRINIAGLTAETVPVFVDAIASLR